MGELRIDLLEERIERLRERTDYLRDEFESVRHRTRRLRSRGQVAIDGSRETTTRQPAAERRPPAPSTEPGDRGTRGATDEEVAAAVRRVERELDDEADAGVEIPIDDGSATDDESADRERTEIIVA